MTQFSVEEVPATVVATIRRRVPVDDLPSFFQAAYGQLMAAVTQAGGSMGGPPFGWYHGVPTDLVDVSAGFPMAGDVHTPEGGVLIYERPAGRAVVGLHIGPYETLPSTYAALEKFAAEQGVVPFGEMWEEYLTEPSGDPSTWQTRVVLLLE